jgi:aldehyde dehydrogenase
MAAIDLARETNVQHALDTLHKAGGASRYGNYIGGRWTPPVHGRYFISHSPINTDPLCEFAKSTPEDVERALDAAHAAKDHWGRTSAAERAAILLRVADRMQENLELLALAETIDNGKPIRETRNADVPLAIDHFRYFAACIRAEESATTELDEDTTAYHFKEPLAWWARSFPGTSRC